MERELLIEIKDSLYRIEMELSKTKEVAQKQQDTLVQSNVYQLSIFDFLQKEEEVRNNEID